MSRRKSVRARMLPRRAWCRPVFPMVSSLPAPRPAYIRRELAHNGEAAACVDCSGSIDRSGGDLRGSAFVLQRHAGGSPRAMPRATSHAILKAASS
jgi:hypothetical protein